MIVDDPDAPQAKPWVHWVIYGIAADTAGMPEDVQKHGQVSDPVAVQGVNSFGRIGYGGPYPPRGDRLHQYRFKLYALSGPLSAPPGLTADELMTWMQGKVIVQGQLTGTYERH